MSQELRKFVVRFNLANPLHQKAWSFLKTMDREKFKSNTNLVAVAIAEYFERYYKNEDDPYFETREREEKFIADILNKVENRLNDLLPQYMFANMMPNTQEIQRKQEQPTNSLPENEDIDWDLLESLDN